jgi:hypothetical protein
VTGLVGRVVKFDLSRATGTPFKLSAEMLHIILSSCQQNGPVFSKAKCLVLFTKASGVDVMITKFRDFSHVSAKNSRLFW